MTSRTANVILEIQTPLQPDADRFIAELARLTDFDAVMLEEYGGISAIVAANMLKRQCDKQIFLKIDCRDRNRIAMHSQLLTAGALGLHNLVIVDGAHPIQTRFPAAKPVYELDSLSLVRMIRHGSPRFGDRFDSPVASLPWRIGVRIGGHTSADMKRAKKFAAAGADLFFVPSLNGVEALKDVIDKPIFLSMAEEEVSDIQKARDMAKSAGAHGLNVVLKSAEKVLDGSFAEGQR